MKRCKNKGYTEDECLAMYHYGMGVYFGKKPQENSEDQTYSINYARLTRKDLLKQLDTRIEDVTGIYKDEEAVRFLKQFKLEPYFQHEEVVLKAIRERINVVELDSKFKQLTGTYSYGEDNDGYDPSIFAIPDLREKYKFNTSFIDGAKARGDLKLIESFTIEHVRTLDRKEPDPADPTDNNKFVWRSKTYSLDIAKYKLIVGSEKPKDNSGDYVEIYRVFDGKKESAPAVKGFILSGRTIAVFDTDMESSRNGFGVPNLIEEISEDQLVTNQLFDKLYPDDKGYLRVQPPDKPMFVEIVPTGGKYSEWTTATDNKGWEIPFSYKQEPTKLNFNVKFKHKPSKSMDNVIIEYIFKEYTNGDRYKPSEGNVIEYYKPKAPFNAEVNETSVLDDQNTRKISIITADGEERTGLVTANDNAFTGSKPYMIAYTFGNKRYLIRDENGDGVYEDRKEIPSSAKDTESFGRYSTDSSTEDSGHFSLKQKKNSEKAPN